MLQKLSPYLIAMLIGLMIGIERERHGIGTPQAMGVRSFLLFALMGAIASGLNQPMISLGIALFAATAVLIGYIKANALPHKKKGSLGLTTEIAAMSTFGLGYFAIYEPLLSLALGVVILLVLHNKTALHTFIKRKLKPKEIEAAAILLLLTVGVIPVLPDRTIDPLNIFNPRRLAVIIALIAGIQFLSYAASRAFGRAIGMPLSGFLAGILSSTAAFASYPRQAQKNPQNTMSIAAASIFAVTATLCLLMVLLCAISLSLAYALIIPVTAIILISLILGFSFAKAGQKSVADEVNENPLNLLSAIKLGALLTFLIFLVELTQRFLGQTYTYLITFLGALFELHGIAIASANMLENKTVSLQIAAMTVMIAIVASMVSKLFLIGTLAINKYRRVMLIAISSILVFSCFILFLVWLIPNILLF